MIDFERGTNHGYGLKRTLAPSKQGVRPNGGSMLNESAAARKLGKELCAPVELGLEVDVGVHHHRVGRQYERRQRRLDGIDGGRSSLRSARRGAAVSWSIAEAEGGDIAPRAATSLDSRDLS